MADEDPVFTVGDVVRKLRKAKRWSIRQLEAETKTGGQKGVGRMTISAIERNPHHNYEKETLDALGKAFGKTGAELEAMVSPAPKTPPQRRVGDADLAPEWLAFTRRVQRLTRQAQSVFLTLLLTFEDLRAVRPGITLDGEGASGGDFDQPTAP